MTKKGEIDENGFETFALENEYKSDSNADEKTLKKIKQLKLKKCNIARMFSLCFM